MSRYAIPLVPRHSPLQFNMTSNIKSVSSPSHPIDFEFGDSPKSANVKLIINEVRITLPSKAKRLHALGQILMRTYSKALPS